MRCFDRSIVVSVSMARKVLNEAAAKGDVEQLHPPTDGQNRHVFRQCVFQCFQLHIVQRTTEIQVGIQLGRCPIELGVHVGTTGKEETSHALHQLPGMSLRFAGSKDAHLRRPGIPALGRILQQFS